MISFEQKKKKAKEVNIESLFDFGKVSLHGRYTMVNCPFHKDDSPSFALYDTNTWYCFSEGKGGDSIEFYMKLKDVDFKTAIEELK